MKTSLALAFALVAAASLQTGTAEARSRAGAIATGVVVGTAGALVVGSALAAQPSRCWVERRAVYNRFGEFRGTRPVRVCR
jgi:hypothetical protein